MAASFPPSLCSRLRRSGVCAPYSTHMLCSISGSSASPAACRPLFEEPKEPRIVKMHKITIASRVLLHVVFHPQQRLRRRGAEFTSAVSSSSRAEERLPCSRRAQPAQPRDSSLLAYPALVAPLFSSAKAAPTAIGFTKNQSPSSKNVVHLLYSVHRFFFPLSASPARRPLPSSWGDNLIREAHEESAVPLVYEQYPTSLLTSRISSKAS
jgi:hypothetical protein